MSLFRECTIREATTFSNLEFFNQKVNKIVRLAPLETKLLQKKRDKIELITQLRILRAIRQKDYREKHQMKIPKYFIALIHNEFQCYR